MQSFKSKLFQNENNMRDVKDILDEALARTINTSLSTLIVLLCIFILGGDSVSYTHLFFVRRLVQADIAYLFQQREIDDAGSVFLVM